LKTKLKLWTVGFAAFNTKYGLFNSTVSTVGVKATAMLLAVVTVKCTIGYLGPDKFSVWMAITSVVAFLSFADLGVGNSLVGAIADSNGSGDRERVKLLVSNGLAVLFAIGIFIVLAGAIAIPLIDWAAVLNVKGGAAEGRIGREILVCVAIYVGCYAINLPLSLAGKVQHGQHKLWLSNIWISVGNVLTCFFIWAISKSGGSLPYLILVTAGCPLVASLVNYLVFFGGAGKAIAPSVSLFRADVIKPLIFVGSQFLILQMFSLLGNATDNIIIAHLLGIESVGPYSVVQKLSLMLAFSQFYITALWPIFSEAHERGNADWARRVLIKSIWISGLMGAFSGLVILLGGRYLIGIWTGGALVVPFSLLLGFALQSVLMGIGGVMSVYLNNKTYLSRQTIYFAFSSIIAIVLKFYFIRMFHSSSGAVFGTFFSYTFLFIVPSFFIVFKGTNGRVDREA
jgi:O-antigen/teichoic acid export membrane protein